MDYAGPEAADYVNVEALNVAFLRIFRARVAGSVLRAQLAADLQDAALALSDGQLRRLAGAPFLLLSFRERDADLWRVLVADDSGIDLLGGANRRDDVAWLTAVGLAFLWQLACRNPYAARLVSGAAPDWCDRLSAMTIMQLLGNAAGHRDLLVLRTAGRYDVWRKLLGDGLSRNSHVRRAAHVAVLQAMLTSGAAARYQRLRAAACATVAPSLTIAENPRR